MLLRLVVYWGLGADAVLKRQFVLAVMCFGIPFAGPLGMWIAMLAGILFLIQGFYFESAVAVGLVIFNLVGNQLLQKRKPQASNSPDAELSDQ